MEDRIKVDSSFISELNLARFRKALGMAPRAPRPEIRPELTEHHPSIGGDPIPGGGTPMGRTDLTVFCQCTRCRDYMNVTFWIRKVGEEGVRNAQLEPTIDAHLVDNTLRHQRNGCEGILKGISVPYTLILDGPAYH